MTFPISVESRLAEAMRPVLCLRPAGELGGAVELRAPSHALELGDGTCLVSDTGNQRLQLLAHDGKPLRDLQTSGPYGLALGEDGIFFADCRQSKIYLLSHDFERCNQWAKLRSPIALVIHKDQIFATEQVNHTVVSCALATGVVERRFGGEGSGDGELWCPFGIAAHEDTLYIADSWNHRVARFTLRGEWLGAWGKEGGAPGSFRSPYGVVVVRGALIVSEEAGRRLQVLCALVLNTSNIEVVPFRASHVSTVQL